VCKYSTELFGIKKKYSSKSINIADASYKNILGSVLQFKYVNKGSFRLYLADMIKHSRRKKEP
jgi:hypothetical protein